MHNTNKKITAREAALKALGLYRRNRSWSDLALNRVIKNAGMQPADSALAVHLVYGVLQNMALCDHIAAHFSSIELRKLEPQVLDILRLSIYQIAFLTKIPDSAAVNEGVALVKKYSNPRAAGFVNAVLRKTAKAAANGELPEVEGDAEHVLSIRYSHPEWLVREFCALLGYDGTEALLAANNAGDTPITAQVNTLLTDTDRAIRLLEADGVIVTRHEWLENCIEMSGTGEITRLEAYKRGYIYIQDAASRLAVIAAGPKKGDFVIDGCAAPGGKSFASAIMTENSCRIAACDINPAKLRFIENGAKRLGINVIDAIKRNSSEQSDEFSGIADVVLADVPCSGFGVIRKKPEIRYKSEQDIAGFPDLQKRILTTLASYVAPGGTLVYSTCTLMRRENEEVIQWFLRANSQFSKDGYSLPGIGEVRSGMITLWPHINGTDGFFICKLRKCRM